MKLKLDENLPESLVSALSALGHDVDNVRLEGLRAARATRTSGGQRKRRGGFLSRKTSTSRTCANFSRGRITV